MKSTQETTTPQIKKFRRHADAAAGIYYRLDKGLTGGRNSESTERTLEWHIRSAQQMIAEDARTDDAPLCTYLDENPKLADKWNRLERRFFGARA